MRTPRCCTWLISCLVRGADEGQLVGRALAADRNARLRLLSCGRGTPHYHDIPAQRHPALERGQDIFIQLPVGALGPMAVRPENLSLVIHRAQANHIELVLLENSRRGPKQLQGDSPWSMNPST